MFLFADEAVMMDDVSRSIFDEIKDFIKGWLLSLTVALVVWRGSKLVDMA